MQARIRLHVAQGSVAWRMLLKAPLHSFVDILAETDAQDQDRVPLHLQNDSVFTNPQLTVSLQRPLRRLGIPAWGRQKPVLDGRLDSLLEILVDLRKVPSRSSATRASTASSWISKASRIRPRVTSDTDSPRSWTSLSINEQIGLSRATLIRGFFAGMRTSKGERNTCVTPLVTLKFPGIQTRGCAGRIRSQVPGVDHDDRPRGPRSAARARSSSTRQQWTKLRSCVMLAL